MLKCFSDNNGFVKGMREFKQCVEREQIIFNVQVNSLPRLCKITIYLSKRAMPVVYVEMT